LHLVCFGPWG
jgi:Proteins of 100 residues with WXG